jgi:hypothetical protein
MPLHIGVTLSLEWQEALWGKFVTGALCHLNYLFLVFPNLLKKSLGFVGQART